MKIILSLAVLLIGNFAQVQNTPTRILVLGLDGFSSEGFRKAKHLNLDRMIADGALSLTTRPVMPSVTLPNWTSHLRVLDLKSMELLIMRGPLKNMIFLELKMIKMVIIHLYSRY
ncbi:hypothetical protein EZ449_11445 [Pedobacter frigidisoli]|uniref:Type I phosphodiesterase / nucleotide pyrophosphatase n=1 Tax=Pedobacter frigidisoli TaxID=2530455 RepID=A0A4R0P3U8_9SPHI|nr:alkaline phosphatase family protein [Pedobacter frigidisoli]TCD08458.1 hypothetical protein EZ449_11445 [Pedobacter frigidisoli]